MRRRDVLTGLGSAGVLAGAGAVAVYGLPSVDELTGETESDQISHEPLELETVDAPGSDAGTAIVPDADRATFIDLFGTWCTPCIEQMPALVEAHERVADEAALQFVSVTNESVGEDGQITRDELAAWWDEHGGNWTVALDPAAELSAYYLQSGYPTAVTIAADGRVLWVDDGVKPADELVDKIEEAIEASEGVGTGSGDG